MLDGQLVFLMDVIDNSDMPVIEGMRTRFRDLQAEWTKRQDELREVSDQYIEPINGWASANRIQHVGNPLGSD